MLINVHCFAKKKKSFQKTRKEMKGEWLQHEGWREALYFNALPPRGNRGINTHYAETLKHV